MVSEKLWRDLQWYSIQLTLRLWMKSKCNSQRTNLVFDGVFFASLQFIINSLVTPSLSCYISNRTNLDEEMFAKLERKAIDNLEV